MTTGARVAAVVGILAHVGVGVFPYSASGLLAPLWAVVLLGGVWVALLALAAVLVRRRRGWPVLAVAPVALGLWALVMLVGDRFLGWTA